MTTLRRLLPSAHTIFVFEAAARHLNFRNAAQELNVTQPSVSHTIKALETRCGTRLFIRENRGVRLTEAGRELYEAVRGGFNRIETSLKQIAVQGTPYLTLAASGAVAAHWLLPQVSRMRRDLPALRIKIVTTDRDVEPDSDIDLTIWLRPRSFQRPGSWHLCDEVVFPVCSPAYLARHPGLTGAEALPDHPLLHAFDPHRPRMSWSDWMQLAGARPLAAEPGVIFSDFLLAIQAALAGEGIALGWNLTFDMLLESGLLVRPIAAEIRTGNAFFLIGPGREEPSEATRALAGWILDRTGHLRR